MSAIPSILQPPPTPTSPPSSTTSVDVLSALIQSAADETVSPGFYTNNAAHPSATIPIVEQDGWDYLLAHQGSISEPSYRYAYIFWGVFFAIAAIYTIAHHLRLSAGALGAWYSRWGMRRIRLRLSKTRSFVLPSNSMLIVLGAVTTLLLACCTVGPDFVGETEGAWQHQNGVTHPSHTAVVIHKTFWTSGNRFGAMAFAAMPLVVTLGLKAKPFAVFSLKWFTGLHWDKVGTFHRAGGWVVWFITTMHVVLWLIQLHKDQYDGRPVFFLLTTIYRFRCALVSYISMTLAMILSLRPIREMSYEMFYFSHCALMLTMLVTAMIHHSTIGYWIIISLALWGGDRLYRWARFHYTNGGVAQANKRDSIAQADKEKARGFSNGNTLNDIYIPPGMANVQLLPSRTLRLTVRPPHPIKWEAGQSVFLTLPTLSNLQSHPFSIANNDPNEMVFVIKARSGLTRKLYDKVHEDFQRQLAVAPLHESAMALKDAPTVHIPVAIDGPMGSAGRMRWTEFSTVLLVVGGSGVTFALGICDMLAKVMSDPHFKGKTRRVRFVWVVREYAEISWAASALCRFRGLLNDLRLQIDIFVTKDQPRKRQPLQISRSDSLKSTLSSMTQASAESENSVEDDDEDTQEGADDLPPPRRVFGNAGDRNSRLNRPQSRWLQALSQYTDPDIDPETQLLYTDVINLTQYYHEADVNDAAEDVFSRHIQAEGRKRRAHSRYVARQSAAMSMVGRSTSSFERTPEMTQGPMYNHWTQGSPSKKFPGSPEVAASIRFGQSPQTIRSARFGLSPQMPPVNRSGSPHLPSTTQLGTPTLADDGFVAPSFSPERRPVSRIAGFSASSDARSLKALSSYSTRNLAMPPPALTLAPRQRSSTVAEQLTGGGLFVTTAFNNSPLRNTLYAEEEYEMSPTGLFGRPDEDDEKARGGHTPPDTMYESPFEAERDSLPMRRLSMSDDDHGPGLDRRAALAALAQPHGNSAVVMLEGRTGPTAPDMAEHTQFTDGSDMLWIDEADYAATTIISENARTGRPPLASIVDEELDSAQGAIIVGTCGPAALNTAMRKLVSLAIDPSKIHKGDASGHVVLYTEDFEM